MLKLALHVESIPIYLNNGCAQWFPDLTQTPLKSSMLATSCGCTPFMLNDITDE